MPVKRFLQSGFTLVELMVVVAIIGILGGVAIPKFRVYQAKSKTAQAKLLLSSIYTAEMSFAAEFDVYSACCNTRDLNVTYQFSIYRNRF